MKVYIIVLSLLTALIGCTKVETPTQVSEVPENPKEVFSYHQYPCAQKNGGKNDSVVVIAEDNDILVWHYNMEANCCDTTKGKFKRSGDTLKIYEKHGAADCYCICYFTMSFRIDNLDTGQYYLRVYKENDSTLLRAATVSIPYVPPKTAYAH